MDLKDFVASEAGRVLHTPTGYAAFVPAPLPPKLVYSGPLVLALSRADSALSELSGVGRNLLNPHLLISPYRLREAVLSSKIEGTRASLSDLLIEEISPEATRAPQDDRHEVRNYVGAMNHGLARLETLPLSLRLVCELHEKLMRGVRGDKATPGEFRRSQNWIGPQGSTPMTAPYVPPPPQEMQQCLHDWELFLHRRDELPDLVQCALMHEQFEAIHPFLDGNGRVGRLLITLFLIERKRLTQPLLYLSEFIEAHRQDYYDCLQRVRTHGDWQGWLLYFLRGVEETAGRAVAQASRLNDLRETLGRKLGRSATARNLLDALFVNPYVNVTNAAQRLRVAFPTAQRAIHLLEKEGVLEEVSGRSWGRFYVSRPILEAIEDGAAASVE
jgi:Fic family protein